MIRRPPRSTLTVSSAASDVYKRQSAEPVKRDPKAHVVMWDPEPLGQYVSTNHIAAMPVILHARVGYRPTRSVGSRAVCGCRQRRWGSSCHCCFGQHCLGSQGDMLNRMLIPDKENNVWKPGVVVCDSFAAMISLAGRAEQGQYKDCLLYTSPSPRDFG